MLKLNRRTVLAAAAAGLVARALPAFAASPYTFKHGALEVMVVSDGYLLLPTSFLAHGAPPADREAILNAAGQTGDQYQSPTNITLVRSERDLILIDMGSRDRFMPSAGKLWDNLKAAGIDQAKITKVVFTHGHPDHLWGTVDELDDLYAGRKLLWMRPADCPPSARASSPARDATTRRSRIRSWSSTLTMRSSRHRYARPNAGSRVT